MAIKRQLLLMQTLVFMTLPQTIINADTFYKEARIVGGYSNKDKWVGEKGEIMNSLGFEYYKKFSNEYGDFLTLDIQMRFAYDSMADSDDAFGIQFHNAWLEHKFDLGQSIKMGHFGPAFGLEPVLDTHGTLLGTLAEKNIGFKRDWGAGYKSQLGSYDNELALQLGSGMGIDRKDGSFLLTNRISTPTNNETKIGLSLLYGQTLQPVQMWTVPSPKLVSDKTVRKKRIGLDLQRPLGILDFKAELAAGDNDGTTVAGGMAEFAYTVPNQQNLTLKMQTLYWSDDWNKKNMSDLTLSPVIEYKINTSSTVSLGYFHDIYSAADKDRMILLQFYYYGL